MKVQGCEKIMKYEKCLVELDEILKHLSNEDLKKIPYEIRKAINEHKDKNYNWKYDEHKELNQQTIDRQTIAMLSYINMEYLLNKEQKLLMHKIHTFNENKAEEEKSKKYNPKNIFKNTFVNEKKENTTLENTTNLKWYKKFFHL